MLRVLPRDAFNDANLLKCIGQLTMAIGDDLLPNWHFHYDGEPFNIIQDENDGSTEVANITFWYKKKQVRLFRGVNSREAWPLWIMYGEEEYEPVFDDQGNITFK